jgi:hypothetical protein
MVWYRHWYNIIEGHQSKKEEEGMKKSRAWSADHGSREIPGNLCM